MIKAIIKNFLARYSGLCILEYVIIKIMITLTIVERTMRRAPITLKYMKAVSAALCALVLSLALISYCPEDQSVIYDASDVSSVVSTRNYLGSWGAQIAGLLIYLLGGTAWVLVGMCFYLSYRCRSKTAISVHSFLAFFISILVSAYMQVYPGACGLYLLECLHALLEPSHVMLLIYCLLWSCSVLWVFEPLYLLFVYVRMQVKIIIKGLIKRYLSFTGL
jgi:hypothetical protein